MGDAARLPRFEGAILKWWNRLREYIAEVWLEVRPREGKVTWPAWPEVKGSTLVVLATVGITLFFLGMVDAILAKAVQIAFGR